MTSCENCSDKRRRTKERKICCVKSTNLNRKQQFGRTHINWASSSTFRCQFVPFLHHFACNENVFIYVKENTEKVEHNAVRLSGKQFVSSTFILLLGVKMHLFSRSPNPHKAPRYPQPPEISTYGRQYCVHVEV